MLTANINIIDTFCWQLLRVCDTRTHLNDTLRQSHFDKCILCYCVLCHGTRVALGAVREDIAGRGGGGGGFQIDPTL